MHILIHPFLNLRILKFLPIHLRRTSHFVSELPVEIGKVAETIVVRDFGHTPRRTAQRLAGGFDPKLCQIFNGPESEGLLKTAHKIAFAQMRQPGKFLYGKRVGEVLLDIGEHRPQVFSSRRHGGTIGAEFRRCGEQIEEAEQLTFQQKIGDSRVFTDAAENLMDGCRKCSITGMFG